MRRQRGGEFGDRYRDLIAAAAQRLHAHGSGRHFVVADDERERCAAGIGLLHLRLEAAAAGIDHDRLARVAQHLSDARRELRAGFAGVDDVGNGRRSGGEPGLLQQQDHPLDAHRESAGRRRLAAELLEESVVAPAAGDGPLRAEPVGHPFEHGAIVIVEAAHEAGVDGVGDAMVGEQLPQPVEMRARIGGQALEELRRAFDQILHRRVLAVENAQRIGVQTALRVVVEQRGMPLEVLDQVGAVRAPLVRVADRIEGEVNAVGKAETSPQPREQHDLLGVDVGSGEAQRLDVELVELAVAALLRPLVAEHRARRPHPLRPFVGEVVLDRGADDAGGRLRTQRQALAVQLVLERVHLVLDDVGHRADAAHEQRRRLDDRHAKVAVAVLAKHVADRVLENFPERGLVGQHVVHAADGLQGRGHGVTQAP